MIIGIAGKKQSGKSTAAAVLEKNGWVVMSFAATLKKMIWLFLIDSGLTYEQIEFSFNNKELIVPNIGCTMRHLLQTLGTEWGRSLISENCWIETALVRLDKLAIQHSGISVVIEDVRFESEYDFIREQGGQIIHIHRHLWSQEFDGHVSEKGLVPRPGELIINNNGSLDDFKKNILSAVKPR